MRRWRTSTKAPGVLGLVPAAVIVVIAIAALAAPLLAPHDPLRIIAEPLAAPARDASIPLGSDHSGRDLLSRLLFGARLTLGVAISAVATATLFGGAMGLIAAYFRGWVDTLLSRVTDVMFALPEVLLALVLLSVLQPGPGSVALAIAIVYTPIFARVSRAAALSVMQQPFIEASRALGLGHGRIMLRHVLPNIRAPLLVQITLSLAFAVLAESALSFLGLSGQTDQPSWGAMLRQGKDYMLLSPWLAIFPGVAITALVLSFNLLGDALQTRFDPRRKK